MADLNNEQRLAAVKTAVDLGTRLLNWYTQATALEIVFTDFAIIAALTDQMLIDDPGLDHLTKTSVQEALTAMVAVKDLIEDAANSNDNRKALRSLFNPDEGNAGF
jgi:hypothetical protein